MISIAGGSSPESPDPAHSSWYETQGRARRHLCPTGWLMAIGCKRFAAASISASSSTRPAAADRYSPSVADTAAGPGCCAESCVPRRIPAKVERRLSGLQLLAQPVDAHLIDQLERPEFPCIPSFIASSTARISRAISGHQTGGIQPNTCDSTRRAYSPPLSAVCQHRHQATAFWRRPDWTAAPRRLFDTPGNEIDRLLNLSAPGAVKPVKPPLPLRPV